MKTLSILVTFLTAATAGDLRITINVVFPFVGSLHAQTFHGANHGIVNDSSGSAIPDMQVILTREQTNSAHQGVTGSGAPAQVDVTGGTRSVFPLADFASASFNPQTDANPPSLAPSTPPLAAAPAGGSAAADCPQQSRDPGRIRALLITALAKQANGEFASARAMVEGALTETPECLELLNTLGSLEQDTGEYLAAERAYLRALRTANVAPAPASACPY